MTVDKSAFKSTSNAALKAKDQQVSSTLGKSSGRTGRLELQEGFNQMRIYPFHPDGGGDTYAEPVAVWFLPIDVPEREQVDGNWVEKKDKKGNKIYKRIQKPVFHAKVHGTSKKDVVEEYRKFVENWAKANIKDEKERALYLKPLYPVNGMGGLTERETWVCYAHNEKDEFGTWEFGRAVRMRLDQLAANESANDPLGTDPFTDVEDGIAVTVTRDKKNNDPKKKFVTELAPQTEGKGKDKVIVSYALTNENLEQLLKATPLYKMYRGVYGRKDFDWALQGIQNFDKENKLNVCQYDEWEEIVDQLVLEYPDKDEETEEELEGDDFDAMDREELKAYNRENGVGYVVRQKDTDDDLRDIMRQWKLDNPFNEKTEEESEEEEAEEEENEDGIKDEGVKEVTGKTNTKVQSSSKPKSSALTAARERLTKKK